MAKAQGSAEAEAKIKAKLVEKFDPETQVVVNKRKFEELMFHLGTNRTATYVRHATIQRLADLLELEGGLEEAREVYTKMVERVMAG